MSNNIIQHFEIKDTKIKLNLKESSLADIYIFKCDVDDAIISQIYYNQYCAQKLIEFDLKTFNPFNHENKFLLQIKQNNKCQIINLNLKEENNENNRFISLLSYKQLIDDIKMRFQCSDTEAAQALHIQLLQQQQNQIKFDASTCLLNLTLNVFNTKYQIFYTKGHFQISNYEVDTYITNLPDLNQNDFQTIKFVNNQNDIRFYLQSSYDLPIVLYINSKPVYYGFQLIFDKQKYGIQVNDRVRIKIVGETECLYSDCYIINEVETINRNTQSETCEVIIDQEYEQQLRIQQQQERQAYLEKIKLEKQQRILEKQQQEQELQQQLQMLETQDDDIFQDQLQQLDNFVDQNTDQQLLETDKFSNTNKSYIDQVNKPIRKEIQYDSSQIVDVIE